MATLTRNLISADDGKFTVDVSFSDVNLRVASFTYRNVGVYNASWTAHLADRVVIDIPGVPSPIPPGTPATSKNVPGSVSLFMLVAPAGAATDYGPDGWGIDTTLG